MANRWGNNGNSDRQFFFFYSKITADGDCSHEIKRRLLLGRKVMNIHNYLFKKYLKNNIYVCFDVEEEKLKDSVYGIKALNIKGCNVTIPHKVNIIKYIDIVSDNAKLIGAVNTIKNEGGILKGYNTDGIGFVKSILDMTPLSPPSELQEIPVAIREQSGVLCFHSR